MVSQFGSVTHKPASFGEVLKRLDPATRANLYKALKPLDSDLTVVTEQDLDDLQTAIDNLDGIVLTADSIMAELYWLEIKDIVARMNTYCDDLENQRKLDEE